MAQPGQAIYTDALVNGWQNWGWATLNFNNVAPVHSGSASISISAAAWQAIYLHHDAFASSAYTNLAFWIHGGPGGGQRLQVQAMLSGTAQLPVQLAPLPANAWQQITLSLDSLSVANKPNLDGFWIQDSSGTTQPTFYVDDISLTGVSTPPPSNNLVLVNIDANANRHAISPNIYGVAFADASALDDLNCPLNRSGGNASTCYNWQLDVSNRGADWYFESIGSASATAGADGDSLIRDAKSAGTQPMLTIPMVDWVAKCGPNRAKLCSFSIAKYGPQTGNDAQWYPDAGNGILANGAYVTGNDPNDANVPAGVSFQQGWIQHLIATWGTADAGGLRYYILDNEPSLWHTTHRDIHPTGATMDEVRNKMVNFATAIKAADPAALVMGPEEWGWSGYFYSGYDLQYGAANGWANLPDRASHGGWDYLPWILDQIRQQSAGMSQRLLDIFTVHYYPQGGEFSDNVSNAMQLLRNRSTRSLWDTNYVDESWINDKVRLISRIRGWANTYYPGTQVGITEYNWGAENHINGATAQADIYGIFGREGLDLATRWATPASSTPTYQAMKMYRNYDGAKSTFGETSVSTSVPNPDNLSCFAALRAIDGALTVMVISKVLAGDTPVTLNLANFTPNGTAQVWQLTATNAINQLAGLGSDSGFFTLKVPAQSVTLLVFPKGGESNPPPTVSLTAPPGGATYTAPASITVSANASDPDGRIVKVVFDNGATPIVTITNAPYSFIWTGVSVGTYTLTAVATDAAGATTTSDPTTITVKMPMPQTPIGLTATRLAQKGQIKLSWTAATGATSYNAKRSTTTGGPYTTINTGVTTSFTDTRLTSGRTYYYVVSAVNAAGQSGNSSQASATAK